VRAANQEGNGRHSVLSDMMSIQGILQLVGNLSFLQPTGVQLIMRNTPPGGSFNQRAAAATAFLTQGIGAGNGSAISVTGDPDPLDPTVFLMDSAV
jgi:hypothetical protein